MLWGLWQNRRYKSSPEEWCVRASLEPLTLPEISYVFHEARRKDLYTLVRMWQVKKRKRKTQRTNISVTVIHPCHIPMWAPQKRRLLFVEPWVMLRVCDAVIDWLWSVVVASTGLQNISIPFAHVTILLCKQALQAVYSRKHGHFTNK